MEGIRSRGDSDMSHSHMSLTGHAAGEGLEIIGLDPGQLAWGRRRRRRRLMSIGYDTLIISSWFPGLRPLTGFDGLRL